jgi:hypothetical protein
MIVDNWKQVSVELASAQSINSVSEYAHISAELKEEFDDSFKANRSGLMATVSELEIWLEEVLKRYSVVSILGV